MKKKANEKPVDFEATTENKSMETNQDDKVCANDNDSFNEDQETAMIIEPQTTLNENTDKRDDNSNQDLNTTEEMDQQEMQDIQDDLVTTANDLQVSQLEDDLISTNRDSQNQSKSIEIMTSTNPNDGMASSVSNAAGSLSVETTRSQRLASKLAEHDALYFAEQRRQDAYYEQFENGCDDGIPDCDENILFNLEKRKRRNICPHCKGQMVNGDIRAHLAQCTPAKLAREKRFGVPHNVSVATSSVGKNRKPEKKLQDK